jgi:hypothetical protein
MASPLTVTDLFAFMGETFSGDDLARLTSVMSVVTAMVRSYTRGVGFDAEGNPEDDLKAVTMSATARMLKLPPPGIQSENMGPFMVQYSSQVGFSWTVAEQYVLDRYRVRAQ